MGRENTNRVTLSGNLTRDPELRHTGGGTPVCSVRLACNTRRKDASGEWVEKPNYFDVTVWGRQGENLAEHLSKGSPIMVDGRLSWREWQDQGGNKRQSVEIVAHSVEWLPDGRERAPRDERFAAAPAGADDFSRPAGGGGYDAPAGGGGYGAPAAGSDDDIPF